MNPGPRAGPSPLEPRNADTRRGPTAMTHPHDQHDALPDGLIDALRELDGPAALPSAEHDDALLARARAHLAEIDPAGVGGAASDRRRRPRYVLGFIGAGGAVAAAATITFAVWVGMDGRSPAGPTLAENAQGDTAASQPSIAQTEPGDTPVPNAARQPSPTVAGDLDGSGALDILDAFALARAVQQGAAPQQPGHDFNRDGRVDLQDADWLATRAVAVTRDGGRG